MKLLIITSEPLNPRRIIDSTFELSQAKLLSRIAEIGILSVSPHDSLSAAVKSLLRKAVQFKFKLRKGAALKRVLDILSVLVFKRNRVNTYVIEGIEVYEGKNFQYVSSSDFKKNMNSWVESGYSAYKIFETRHGRPEVVHAHGRFLNAGALALKLKEREKIEFVYTEHSTAYQSGTAPIAARPVLSDIVENASIIVAVSKPLLNQMELFLGRKIEDAIVLPNVLDPVFETALNFKETDPDCFRFLVIASLHKKKGLDILLKAFHSAFANNKDYRLTICGEGPLRSQLEQIRIDLDLQDCVSFAGNLPKEAIKENLDLSDAVVVSSLEETFGVAVIEALSRGCPVIATRSGGPEFILTDEFGILIERGNQDELCNALKRMVSQHTSFNRIGMRNFAISKFGSETFLLASTQLYSKALNKSSCDCNH